MAFFEKGLDMLEPGGTLCFICPDRWLHNAYGRRLRKRISLHFTLSLHELERPVGDEGYVLGDPEQLSFLGRTARSLPTLEEAGVTSGIGLATGCDAVFIVDGRIGIEPSRLLPLLVRAAPGQGLVRRKWLVNPWNEGGTLVDLEQFPPAQELSPRP